MASTLSDATHQNIATHDFYMRRCLQLAGIAAGYTAPNPMVGALLVCDDKIIGEGYHRRYGQPHAEPNAINSVKDKSLLSRSTLYVNLEPCSHFGKTPPCANLIVNSGIPRVVIGTFDPNPKVAGRGVKILEDAGIEVVVGILEAKCRELNRRFFIYQEEKRPFVLLKWAQTSDGYLDRLRTDNTEAPLSISNEITRQLTHKMRSENQSILVSTNTVLLDNPSLTVRNWSGKNPVRIALDRQDRIPKNYNLLNGKNQTLIFTGNPGENGHNLEYIPHTFDEDSLQTMLSSIYKKGIHSVLVEGGAKLLQSFIEAGLWDEAHIEISQQKLCNGVKAPVLNTLPVISEQIQGHAWLHFKNPKPNFSQ